MTGFHPHSRAADVALARDTPGWTRAGTVLPAPSNTWPRSRPVGVGVRRTDTSTSLHDDTGPPPIAATYIAIGPKRFEMNANDRPSGETAGENSPIGSAVSTTELPPPDGTIATSFEPASSEP